MDRRLVFGTLLALLGAGCISNVPEEVDAAALDLITEGGVGRSGIFHEGIVSLDTPRALGGQYDIGVRATEPTIGVTADGVIFMTGFGAMPAGERRIPTVMRSMDKGQTWEDAGPGTHLSTNDPLVFVDVDTGRVYMSDILPLSCTFLSWSDDLGESWTTNPYACGNSNVNDHQTIVTAWPRVLPTIGYEKIVYICANNVAYFACATSLNGGLTFGPQIPVDHGFDTSQELPVCSALTAHLRAGPDGKVYLPKADCSIQDTPPVVYVTEDDGMTWTKKRIADVPMAGHEVGFAVDPENNLYATWEGPEGRQWFAASNDAGETWSAPRDVTAPGVTATMFTALAAGGVGEVAFAYIGSTIEGGYEGKDTGNGGLAGDLFGQPDLPEWDNATWNGYIGIITDVFGTPVIQSVSVNDPADPLARRLCGGTRCHGMNDFIDMVVDAEGRPWVAFVDVCNEECRSDPTMDSDWAQGFAGTLVSGPSLLTGVKELIPLAPPPARE